MPEVTNIVRQKTKRQRVNLFIDNEFVCGLSDSLLVKYKLFAGKSISANFRDKVIEEAIIDKYYDRILTLLASRPRSEFEIQIKLKEYFYKDRLAKSGNYLKKIIKKLKNADYIDDFIFAQWLVDSRIKQKRRSWREIISELYTKRVDKKLIEQLLIKYAKKIDNYEKKVIEIIVRKKSRAYLDKKLSKKERVQKIKAYLYNKGFKLQIVNEIMTN